MLLRRSTHDSSCARLQLMRDGQWQWARVQTATLAQGLCVVLELMTTMMAAPMRLFRLLGIWV